MGLLRRLWAPQYQPAQPPVAVLQHKCIRTAGESKSDYQIFSSCRNGSAERLFRRGEERTAVVPRGLPGLRTCRGRSLEALLRKGYYVVPPDKAANRTRVSWRWFAEGRKKDVPGQRRCRPSTAGNTCRAADAVGKIRIHPASLERFGQDPERRRSTATCPREGRQTAALYSRYPLQLVSHPRFSFHTMGDATTASSTTSSIIAC
jgi:trimethylamine-N-oxide reductase (cytochrome c)